MLFALAVTVVFTGLSIFHRTSKYTAELTNVFLFFEFALLQADAIAFNLVSSAIMSGFGGYVMIVAAGMFMTRIGWFLATIAMIMMSWVTVITVLGHEINLTGEILTMVSAVIGGAMFFILRTRAAGRLSEARLREEKYREQLLEAMRHIDTLSGLLPICASCKSIRDEGNNWQDLETYVSGRTEVQFTHSVCPSCQEELYPDIRR